MRFDTIVIGGGLSGLVCGIRLSELGRRVAIFAKGNSKLHYSSGSLELLGYDSDGNEVDNPLAAMSHLPEQHPYRKLLPEAPRLADEAVRLLGEAGLEFVGDATSNHWRISPVGILKPAWLTLKGFLHIERGTLPPWRKVELVSIKGLLDFPSPFVASGLEKMGITTHTTEITLPAIEKKRNNVYSLRSSAISRALSDRGALVSLAGKLNSAAERADAVLLPAVLSGESPLPFKHLSRLVKCPVSFVATLPPSVAGERIHTLLRKRFVSLGGIYLLSSAIKDSIVEDATVQSVSSISLPDQRITASDYVLAGGSFMSGGLIATNERVIEPVFNADTTMLGTRSEWTAPRVFDPQPYMEFGVVTDEAFHALRGGKPFSNLYAVGSILSGHNPVKRCDDSGVSVLTALRAAEMIAAH